KDETANWAGPPAHTQQIFVGQRKLQKKILSRRESFECPGVFESNSNLPKEERAEKESKKSKALFALCKCRS
ncbi:hypothetical protein ABTG32_17605, partial [Acinetobacter baumannii]